MITDADFYHGSDIIRSEFYQFQAVLLDSDEYNNLNNDAIVLYAVLQKRLNLSMENGWLDQNGRTFLYYTREELAEKIKVSLPTCRKAVKQLIDSELLYEVRQGLGKPNRLYLLKPKVYRMEEIAPDQFTTGDYTEISQPLDPPVDPENPQTEEQLQYRVKNAYSQKGKNFTGNYKDKNYTENNYITPSTVPPKVDRSELVNKVKKQIEYDSLSDTYDAKMLDVIVDAVVGVLEFNRGTFRIGKYYHKTSRVKDAFSQVDQAAVVYTIDAIKSSAEPIANYRNYIVSVMFNYLTSPVDRKQNKPKPKNMFCDFEQRNYDYDEILKRIEAENRKVKH